jgi:peroxiredoxin
MVNKIYIISALLLTLLFSLSCKSSKERKELSPVVFKMTEIPPIITEPAARAEYLAKHFWDGTNFTDSSIILITDRLNAHYSIYIQHLYRCSENVARESLKKFIESALDGNEGVRGYILSIVEASLYDPNSIIRNETAYIWVLETLVGSTKIDEISKERYSSQLTLSLKNRPGTKAQDFEYITTTGKEMSLSKTKGDYTLIMFYDPDCQACSKALDFINNSEVIGKMGARLNKIGVYTGEDIKKWFETAGKFNSGWTVAHDKEMAISVNKLYDIRPSPSLYLLNKDKIVLLKDVSPQDLELYFKSTQ